MSDKSTKSAQPVSPSPGQQTLTIQQALDLALKHHTAGRLMALSFAAKVGAWVAISEGMPRSPCCAEGTVPKNSESD